MNNEEKARAIIGEDCKKENCLQCGGRYSAEKGGCAEYQKIMQMAQWKDEQVKQIQEREIKVCNDYIEKHPNNKLMLKYHLGRLSLCDELLGTDSKDKINMAFATMD